MLVYEVGDLFVGSLDYRSVAFDATDITDKCAKCYLNRRFSCALDEGDCTTNNVYFVSTTTREGALFARECGENKRKINEAIQAHVEEQRRRFAETPLITKDVIEAYEKRISDLPDTHPNKGLLTEKLEQMRAAFNAK